MGKKKIPNQVITRPHYCPDCDKNDSPKLGDKFVLLGSTGRVHVREYDGGGVRGMTPHVVQMHKEGKNVEYYVCCCICGVEIYPDKDFPEFDIIDARRYKVTKQDWDALIDFKDKQYYI